MFVGTGLLDRVLQWYDMRDGGVCSLCWRVLCPTQLYGSFHAASVCLRARLQTSLCPHNLQSRAGAG